jgi:hypothetical protein
MARCSLQPWCGHLRPGGIGRHFRRRIGGLDGFPGGLEVYDLSLETPTSSGNALFPRLQVNVLSAQVG